MTNLSTYLNKFYTWKNIRILMNSVMGMNMWNNYSYLCINWLPYSLSSIALMSGLLYHWMNLPVLSSLPVDDCSVSFCRCVADFNFSTVMMCANIYNQQPFELPWSCYMTLWNVEPVEWWNWYRHSFGVFNVTLRLWLGILIFLFFACFT